MADLRQCPLTQRWVLIARQRERRPVDLALAQKTNSTARCPFCAGHESDTPPVVLQYPPADRGQNWQVRVIPNKYPAVGCAPEMAALEPAEGHDTATQPGDCQNGVPDQTVYGFHEVIVESPRHVRSFSQITAGEAAWAWIAARDRIRQLADDSQLRYVQVFKNCGAAAGASLEHVHSQLIALPFVPEPMQRRVAAFQSGRTGRRKAADACPLCAVIHRELAEPLRLVTANSHLVAFCPHASRFPNETWIVPRQHQPSLADADDTLVTQTGQLVRSVLAGIEVCMPGVDYNVILHTTPFDTSADDHYHWHIEILPRPNMVAGYELATECFINTLPPEIAAKQLRRQLRSGLAATAEDILFGKTS